MPSSTTPLQLSSILLQTSIAGPTAPLQALQVPADTQVRVPGVHGPTL